MDGLRALAASSGDKGQDFIGRMLSDAGYASVTPARSAGEARRALMSGEFDTVVVNSPLTDEFGHELAMDAAESAKGGVILIVKGELFDEVSHKVEAGGVLTVAKPVSTQLFRQALAMLASVRVKYMAMENENARLRLKIEELRLVDRAKCALIQYLGMNEGAAHRYIEKQAMDMRSTRREVAEKILKTYEV